MNESLNPESSLHTENIDNRLEELPDHFDAVVVLGKNWREYPKNDSNQSDLKLSIESKMSALAGAEMVRIGLTDKIILPTGKTAGPDFPSEGEAMRDYILHKYEKIKAESILVGVESKDTHGDAEEVLKIIEQNQLKSLALLTVDFHLDRSKKIFENHGISAYPFTSEELLLQRAPHYQKFIADFQKSSRVKSEEIKEWLLKHFLILDPKGKMITKVAKAIRK
jgi:uncharacterized SAM-binding protein YcdF (DUF218 family)